MNKFHNFNLRHNRIGGNSSKASEVSPVFAATGVILTLLFGISVGWAGSVYADYYISQKIAALEISTAGNIKNSRNKTNPVKKLADFFGANPLSKGALPAVKPVPTPPSTPITPAENNSRIIPANQETAQKGIIGREVIDNLLMNPFDEMKRFRIRPKFAGDEPVGIEVQWIQNDSVLTKLGVQKGDVMKSVNGIPMKNMGDITKGINSLLSGTEFNVEILREGAPINLVYTVTDNAGQPVSIIPTAPSTPITPVENNNRITPANPETVQEGIIGREIIDNLMMNPFDEMKRFRIRPKFIGNEPVGIEVQWIQNDSVLTKLGVQKGDVIKSVNGIPMKNMGDITNGINSIMNATEFNVEILRGNAPIYYRYVVR